MTPLSPSPFYQGPKDFPPFTWRVKAFLKTFDMATPPATPTAAGVAGVNMLDILQYIQNSIKNLTYAKVLSAICDTMYNAYTLSIYPSR